MHALTDIHGVTMVTVQTHLKIRGVFRDNAKLCFLQKKVFER